MTTWACVSPSATILIMAAMLLLIFVCYYAMDKKHLESPIPPPTSENDNRGEYTALVTKGKPYKFYCFIFCCDQKKTDKPMTCVLILGKGNTALSIRSVRLTEVSILKRGK